MNIACKGTIKKGSRKSGKQSRKYAILFVNLMQQILIEVKPF